MQAWVAGPGMGTDDAAARRLAAVLATSLPVLIDADGLTAAGPAPGAAAAAGADADHPARGRTRPAARRGPGRRRGAAA